MFFGNKKILGLDIGSTSIKIVELDVKRSGATLQSFLMIPMPAGALGTGEILDGNTISMTLQRALSDFKTKRKNVSIGLWGTSVIIKRISIPKVEKKLIQESLRFEAEQHIPFDINNVTLSYHLLPFESSPETLDILLVAAQNEVIRQYMETVANVGLKCTVVDVAGFALANLFELNYGILGNNEVVALLNIGAQVTNFVAVQNGEVIFCRDVPVGGSSYTSEISKNMGCSFQEAEGLKLTAAKGQEVPEGVSHTIAQVNEQILDEIRSSIDFLTVTNQGLKMSRCLYTGGGSLTPGLIDKMAQGLEMKFEVLNPYRKISMGRKMNVGYLQQVAPFVSVALGLGLRSGND
ncbi:MAG: type IV pilus assembly protein PilM [Bdellovibrionales bacterium]